MPSRVMTSSLRKRRMLQNETPPIVICSPDLARRVRKPGIARLPVVKVNGETLKLAVRSVSVDGKRWKRTRRPGLQGEKEYVLTMDETTGTVRFGDGLRGARPGTGSVNVRTTYRYGQGKSDVVLTYALDKAARLRLVRIATGNVTVTVEEGED